MGFSRRDWLILGGVGIGAALTWAVLGQLLLRSGNGAAQLQATPLADLTGGTRRLSDWLGKVVLCNFWATWCAPCRDEIPMLVELREKYVAKGFEVVGIAIDHADKVREFSAKYKISYPILMAEDVGLDLLRSLGNTASALPYTVTLDRKGAIVSRKLGILQKNVIEPTIKNLLTA